MASTILITGNTYPVKDQLRALGGTWDRSANGWRIPADKANAARALVGPTPAKPAAQRRNWRCPNPRDCGDPTCDGNCGY